MSMFVINVEAKLQWQVTKAPSGTFIGFCEPLGLVSEGSDNLELWLNIQEAVQLALNSLLQKGELDQFLKDRGWSVSPAKTPSEGPIPFEIPMELVQRKQEQRDSPRARH